MSIDLRVGEKTKLVGEKWVPWSREDYAAYLDGWAHQRLGTGTRRDDDPFWAAGFKVAQNAELRL